MPNACEKPSAYSHEGFMQAPPPLPPRQHTPERIHVERLVRLLLREGDDLPESVNNFTISCDLLACCPSISSSVSSFFTPRG